VTLTAGKPDRSLVHELVRTFEVECDADGIAALRVELLRSIDASTSYRLRLWRLETYRVQPRFGPTPNEPADESLWVDWTYALARDHVETFTAETEQAAITIATDTLGAFATIGDGHRAG